MNVFNYFVLQLLDTKTADKKLTLMHFLVDTVQEKFPEILNFESELRFIEKAALGNFYIKLLLGYTAFTLGRFCRKL